MSTVANRLKALGWNDVKAAYHLKVTTVTVWRWKKGDKITNPAAERLLSLYEQQFQKKGV